MKNYKKNYVQSPPILRCDPLTNNVMLIQFVYGENFLQV